MVSNILVVEDDETIRSIVKNYLCTNGYNVIEASDGLQAMVVVKTQAVDLVILDILIPHLDGFTVCRYLRETSMVPIIMLTAKSSDSDKLRGYELGADDYIVKPFNPRVLVAKVRALLRRSNNIVNDDVIEQGGICLNKVSQSVRINGKIVQFTYKEYELLKILISNPGKVFSREELLTRIWGYDYTGNTRTVDTHIKRIRAKLAEEAMHIITLIKSGYKFEVRK